MAAALSLQLTSLGLAQAASTVPAASPAPATGTVPAVTTVETTPGEEIVLLSPFVVDASKDQGYYATATLAGSRINTSLKDVPSSITVVTKEFIDDIGAVNVNDILAYTANTEGTRTYTYAPAGVGGLPEDMVSQNPNASNRVRGLASADTMRDYFYTINWTGFDTYNLDQVTLNRGPNSVLAGLGSPAGIINYSPQDAYLGKTSGELALRYGSWNDKRVTLDANVAAIPGTLAFRVAVAANDVGFKQQPAFQHEKRLYGAVSYKPWKSTTIRASFEHVNVSANRPNSLTPEDDVTQWVTGGKPLFDNTADANNAAFWNLNMVNWTDGRLLIIRNSDGQLENAYNATSQYVVGQKNTSNVPLFTTLHLSNNNYLPLDSMNIQPSRERRDYNAFEFSADQEILRNLNANVAYLHEKFSGDYLNLFRPEYGALYVDVNKYLPDGTLNSHAGEYYLEFRGLDNTQFDWNTNDVGRVTLAYDLDLTHLNRWLGRWQFTGFAEQRETKTHHEQFTTFGLSSAQATTEIGYRYYLGGSAGTTPATTAPVGLGGLTGVTESYYNSASNAWATTALDTADFRKLDARALEKLASQAGTLQGRYWDNRIVGTWGVRRDKDQAGSNTVQAVPLPAAGLASEEFDLATMSKTTQTYGVVITPVQWLSFHYNRAQNWVPHASAIDLLGNASSNPTGTGRDIGFSLNLLKEKLNVKFNWYNLVSSNDSDSIKDSVNMPLAQWAVPYMDLYKMKSLCDYVGLANGATYQTAIAPGIILGDNRLYYGYGAETISKGMEIELTYNITPDWRLMATLSRQNAVQTNIATGLTTFINNRLAYWKSLTDKNGHNVWTTDLMPISVDPNHTLDPWWSYSMTGEQVWQQWSYEKEFLTYQAYNGNPNPQLAKYHGSLVTNYGFSSGALKGFNVGVGARYIDRQIIGTPAILNDQGVVIGLDTSHPYYAHSYFAWDAWIGYKLRPGFLGGKYDLSFELNGRDLEQSGGYRPIIANPDGTHAVFRIVQPRSFYFTTKLDF
jgi:outer membrane receptor protein involved in Fe transport